MMAIALLLAGTVQAGQDKIRAERGYFAALMIVEKAEAATEEALRHRLLGRAAPVLRRAEQWLRAAARKGDDVAGIRKQMRELNTRLVQGRRAFLASTDPAARPVVPNTGTVVIVAREEIEADRPTGTVLGTPQNRARVARRDLLNAWRIERTLKRAGTRTIVLQEVRRDELEAARHKQLIGPKNIGRLTRRAELNAWRMARIETRVTRAVEKR